MNKLVDWFHWIPRLLCIMAILFVSMFALDSFSPGLTLWEQLGGFLIHLIPSFVLLTTLLVAWRWERIGGMVFMAIGLGLSPFVFGMNLERTGSMWVSLGIILMINIPFVMVGALFIISHHLKKKSL